MVYEGLQLHQFNIVAKAATHPHIRNQNSVENLLH